MKIPFWFDFKSTTFRIRNRETLFSCEVTVPLFPSLTQSKHFIELNFNHKYLTRRTRMAVNYNAGAQSCLSPWAEVSVNLRLVFAMELCQRTSAAAAQKCSRGQILHHLLSVRTPRTDKRCLQ